MGSAVRIWLDWHYNDGLAGWFTQFHYAGWFACAAAVVRRRINNRWAEQRRNGIALIDGGGRAIPINKDKCPRYDQGFIPRLDEGVPPDRTSLRRSLSIPSF